MVRGRRLGWHLGRDIDFADRDCVSGDRLLDNRHDAPPLQTTKGAGFHHLNLIANLGLVLFVVNVKDGLAVDDLVIERVRGLVRDRDLDRFVARAACDEADLSFALIALAGDG